MATLTRILVLEGGPADDIPEIALPAAAPTLWAGPLTWDNVTVPQRHAARRVIPWPSGRALGASSSVNGMLYIRGNPLDYDAWRDLYGCSGWGYLDVLPYFRRAEHRRRGGSRYHGIGGHCGSRTSATSTRAGRSPTPGSPASPPSWPPRCGSATPGPWSRCATCSAAARSTAAPSPPSSSTTSWPPSSVD